MAGVVVAPEFSRERPGPWCNDHRSMHCPHVQQYLESGLDADHIGVELGPGGAGELYVLVPVFPVFAVWETLYYEVHMDDTHGGFGLVPPGHLKNLPWRVGVKRLMKGEGAADLGFTLRQTFEDEIEPFLPKLTTGRLNLPWSCKGNAHAVRYQRVVNRALEPRTFHHALADGDAGVQVAMLYTYMRHSRCLFCYVNDFCRDAVRVSPEMAQFVNVPDPNQSPADYDDLVPS